MMVIGVTTTNTSNTILDGFKYSTQRQLSTSAKDITTYAGYTEDYGLIEVRFSLFDSRIDISRDFDTEREKWLFINDITNRALAKDNVYAKNVVQTFPFDGNSHYFVADMNKRKFFIGLNQNKPQAI